MPRGFGGRWDSRLFGHCTTNHPGEQSPFPISHLSHLPISHFSNFPYSHFHIFPFAIFPQLCSRWSHIVFDTCQLLFLHPEIHPVDGILKMCLLPSEQISLHVKSFFAAQKKLNRWFQPKSLSGYKGKGLVPPMIRWLGNRHHRLPFKAQLWRISPHHMSSAEYFSTTSTHASCTIRPTSELSSEYDTMWGTVMKDFPMHY